MDDGLKQRLVGAFVLLSIAVIFVPVMFDRERIEPVDKKTQIPPAPHIEPVVIEEAAAPENQKPAEDPEEMYAPDPKTIQTPVPEPAGVDVDGVPKAWVLQIASFRIRKYAEDFRDKLAKEGYTSYVRTVSTKKGKMSRVFVGPKHDKSILIRQQKEIKKAHKVSPIILKFEP